MGLFLLQDAMVDSFLETGDWFKTSGVKPVEGFLLPRRIWPLINTLGWSAIVTFVVGQYLLSLLLTGNPIAIILVGLIFATCKLFYLTKSERYNSL